MTTAIYPAITPETRIGDIIAARPRLATLFEELHIDYCCGGKQTVAEASASRHLATVTVISLIEAAGQVVSAGPTASDLADLSLTELADHIERTHHAFLKAELPRLLKMAHRTARKHHDRDARLVEVAATLEELTNGMLAHMEKEERILFPLVRGIGVGERPDLAGLIAQMEADHEVAGNLTAKLRILTDGFTPDGQACNTHRGLLAGLAAFEPELHQYVHTKNNILFPKALPRREHN